MRTLIAIAAALGLLGAISLTPVPLYAAPAGDGLKTDSTDISAAKHTKKKKATKKKAKKKKKVKKVKKTKKKKAPAKKKMDSDKKSGLILYRVAA